VYSPYVRRNLPGIDKVNLVFGKPSSARVDADSRFPSPHRFTRG